MRPKLALFLFLAFATIYPVPSCRYKTYAQETDEDAGIMIASTGGVAFTSLEGLARDLSGCTDEAWKYYRLGIVDLEDPGIYDCQLFAYGFLHSVETDGTITSSGGYLGSCVVVRLANGAWAQTAGIGSANAASGVWPVKFNVSSSTGRLTSISYYGLSNTGGIDYGSASSFMSALRDFAAAIQNLPITDSVLTSLIGNARLENFETYDHDNGGVSDLVEWVRGGGVSNWLDDELSSDPFCKCGACCSCECVCGQWSGDECGGTSDDCDCHPVDEPEPECTCANYCCACKCECEKCADGEHEAHKNDNGECDGTSENCPDCHEEDDPEVECTCANYCCACKCECEKCADGTHSAHKNGSTTCDATTGSDGCSCHETTDEECTCANYCCACKCECKKCADGEHGEHKNDYGECDGTSENCSDCHEEDDPDDDECTCANYCCYHACACPVHKDKEASEHSQHGNGATTCDGTTGSGGCSCHTTTDDECTCSNYCCYHTCACKRCASLPAENHSQHKNASATCDGTTGSGGCSCHTTTGEEEDKVEFPEDEDYEVPEVEQKKTFLPTTDFNGAFDRLKNKIAQKFGLEKLSNLLDEDLSGSLPSWSFPLPDLLGGTVVLDLNKLLDYEFVALFRCVLVFGVYYFTATTVFNSLRRLL